MLNEKLLKELDEILREDYKKELEKDELFDFGQRIVSFFSLLLKINARIDTEKEECKTKKL